jgi:selenocysteine lyase/cysteine desulfurase
VGPSTTLNTYVLANALRSSIKPGDEIIVTNQDHEANIGCWRRLEKEGAIIREWQIDQQTGLLDPDDLDVLLSEKTRLVCFTLCSNIVAAMQNLPEITARIRPTGALIVGDGVSYAPHKVLDVANSGLDIFLFSTYKTYAPHTGVMWINAARQGELESQGHFFNKDLPHYRLNPTGPLHAEIGALAGLRDYYETLFHHHKLSSESAGLNAHAQAVCGLFEQHEAVLGNRLLDFLNSRSDIRVIGSPRIENGNRASTISFVSNRRPSEQIANRLADFKVGCSSGNFYAMRCVRALGIESEDGVARISMVHYNTMEEVDRAISGLEQILG